MPEPELVPPIPGYPSIQIDEYPESLRKQRREIDRLLTRLGGKIGYIIPHNLQKMKNKTASKIAALILDIYFALVEEQVTNRKLL